MKEPAVIKDSVIAGLLIAFGLQVIPRTNGDMVEYLAHGDIEGTLTKIYDNVSIGSRDVLQGVKAARSMIFVLRGGNKR